MSERRRYEFAPSDVEAERIDHWHKKHREVCGYEKLWREKGIRAAAGGGIDYTFSPCGLGTGITVECSCKVTTELVPNPYDATDIDSW